MSADRRQNGSSRGQRRTDRSRQWRGRFLRFHHRRFLAPGFLFGFRRGRRGFHHRRSIRQAIGRRVSGGFFTPLGLTRGFFPFVFFRFRHRGWREGVIALLRGRRQVRHILAVVAPQLDRNVLVDRAGVRFLFRDAKFRQQVQYFVGLYFQFPGQLVNSDLTHRQNYRFRRRQPLLIAAILFLTGGFRRVAIGGTSVFYRSRLSGRLWLACGARKLRGLG